MSPRQEAAAIVVLGLLTAAASLAGGCSERRTRYVSPPPAASLEPAPDPEPEEVRTPPRPPEEVGGHLAALHVDEVGIGSYPHFEPWAPPGRWVETLRGAFLWIPAFAEAAGLLMPVIAEVDTTLPRHDMLFAPDPAWVGVRPGTRVVVTAGNFALGNRLAAGLTAWKAWHDPATRTDHDVLYCAWRPQSSGPFLPALSHEAAHSWTGSWLGEQ